MSVGMPRLLVTLPNVKLADAPRVVLIDPATGRTTLPRLPEEIGQARGITGAALADGRLYLVAHEPPSVHVLGPTLELEQSWSLGPMGAPHSIVVDAAAAFVVATAADTVVRLELKDGHVIGQDSFWRGADGSEPDQLHLNGLCRHDGRLVVSGFGRRAPKSLWADARDGFLQDVGSGEILARDLANPHSPTPATGDLVLCESSESLVRTLDGSRSVRLTGYTRGVAVVGDDVFVGVSRGRRLSESSGVVGNPADPGRPTGVCSVHRLARATLEPREAYDLSGLGREIYDVLHIPDTSDWPLLDEDEARTRLVRSVWDAYEIALVELAESRAAQTSGS